MRVNIGPYSGDLISIRRWEISYTVWRHKTYHRDEEDYDRIDKIVYGFLDKLFDLVLPINRWGNRRKRKIKVRIDNYDVWSADHTLALIIHPVLVKLKEQMHGSPNVDDEDVPDHIKSTAAGPKENEWDTDDKHFDRWNWVLDEMIWAFEQCTDHDNGDSIFYHNVDQLEMKFESTGDEKLDGKGMKSIQFNHQKYPNKPAYWVDEDGKKAHYERIKNGHRLFAKYYFGLWD
jgi:hypothetical protein